MANSNWRRRSDLLVLQPHRAVLGVCFLILVVLCLLVTAGLRREYVSEIKSAEATTENLAHVMEEHTRQSMSRVELLLTQATSELAGLDIAKLNNDARLRQRLRALIPGDALIRTLAVVNAEGRIVLSTLTDDVAGLPSVANRDYFQEHRTQANRGHLFGATTKSRVSDHWIIPISVRLASADGTFQGVLVGILEPAYFQAFYNAINTGENGFVTLFSRRGFVLARTPFSEPIMERNWLDSAMFTKHVPVAAAKTVQQVIRADGVERVYSYRVLSDFPLIVCVGVSLTDRLKGWRARAWEIAAIMLLSLLALAIITREFFRQIRERKQAESALQLSEFSIQNASVATYWIDRDSKIQRINKAACTMLGYTEAELLARPITELDPDFPPERWPIHWEELRSRKKMIFETNHRHRDGHLVPVEVDLNHFEFDGHEYNFANVREISDRIRARQVILESRSALHEAQSLAQIGSYKIDIATGSWESSPALDDIFGIYSGYTKDAASWDVLLAPEYHQGMLAQIQQVIKNKGTLRTDCEIIRPDGGGRRWVAVLGGIVMNERAVPMYLKGTVQDITERKLAETALQTALKEKVALLNEVHHRVKNNLQVISSLLNLEAGRSGQPETNAVLMDMQGRVRSMAMLHESLYRGGVFSKIDLAQYLRQLATEAHRSHRGTDNPVKLHCKLDPVGVSMEQALPCGLIINELITNAFKHGFPGGLSGDITVRLHALNDSTEIEMSVEDNGVGLPADFETRPRDSLGLLLVSDLATQINGKLTIGPGATFTVRFTGSGKIDELAAGS